MKLLALDWRGHGASGQAPGPYTAAGMADDLAAVLDDAGWDRAVTAGCSMGGCVALAFAARHPAHTATPPSMAQEIVRRIPRALLNVLEGARHLTPLERPGDVADILRGAAA